jgi:uncharacterized protein YaiI (UPF0178 family)
VNLIIDGDGQCDKKKLSEIAALHGIKTVIVTSLAHFTQNEYGAEMVFVDSRSQEADIKIMNLAQKGDIAVTQDTKLAYMLTGKGVTVIDSRGNELDAMKAELRMNTAFAERKARQAKKGKIRHKGPSPMATTDHDRLFKTLERAIIKGKGEMV